MPNGDAPPPLTALGYALSSNASLIRALVLILGTLTLLGLTVAGIAYAVDRLLEPNMTVRLTKTGTVFELERADRFSPVVVNASMMWTPTDVQVTPGDSLNIVATGSIHLGLHRLVEAAACDIQPPYTWNGPAGRLKASVRPKDIKRRDLTLHQSDSIGQLLIYLKGPLDAEPNPQTNPRPPKERRFVVANQYVWANNSSDTTYTVWFGINDLVLADDSVSRIGYLASANDPGDCFGNDRPDSVELHRLMKNWKTIAEKRQWDLYYHDNIGSFFVQVKVH